MAGTKEKIFSSKVKFRGVFLFADFYKFCHEWLTEEPGFGIVEDKYIEKLSGDSKEIDIEWTGGKEMNDYFKLEIKVVFKVTDLTQVEVVQNNAKIKTNKGAVEVKVNGNLIKDYKGRFETSGTRMFLRSIYEKWVITSGIDAMKDKLVEICNEFLSQAKAYLDLEGKK